MTAYFAFITATKNELLNVSTTMNRMPSFRPLFTYLFILYIRMMTSVALQEIISQCYKIICILHLVKDSELTLRVGSKPVSSRFHLFSHFSPLYRWATAAPHLHLLWKNALANNKAGIVHSSKFRSRRIGSWIATSAATAKSTLTITAISN
jgi:hypothetical protein